MYVYFTVSQRTLCHGREKRVMLLVNHATYTLPRHVTYGAIVLIISSCPTTIGCQVPVLEYAATGPVSKRCHIAHASKLPLPHRVTK